MNRQLLLVEDDDAVADTVRLHLAEAGFGVLRAFDGDTARHAFAQPGWDLVLLDLTLPGADGWDLCRELRERLPMLPILILSARSSEAHRVLGLELGADDYLAKPFSMLEMVARVRALLRRAQMRPQPGAQLQVGALRFDPQRRTLQRGSAPVPRDKVFSAAMFPPRAGDTRPPGYLYVVLEGQAREQVAGPLGLRRAWQTASVAAALALLATLALGAFTFRRLTGPLHALARRMREFNVAAVDAAAASTATGAPRGDEVSSIAASFDAMQQRIEQQVQAQAAQDAAHREVMAGVAHDLRTPLTALHGHLEALALPGAAAAPNAQHLAGVALAQSDKVRRLTQQLFELATLQTVDHVLHRDRFRLDELVADTVQKFELIRPLTPASPLSPVALSGLPPGRVELDGDLQLIERALTNLIDNALRHARSDEPVRVSLQCDGARANVLVEDHGPGLPQDIAQRLDSGQGVREPPLRRPGGGIGGLGLAIAQRIALLHGGSLTTLPAPGGGTRLSLSLPLA